MVALGARRTARLTETRTTIRLGRSAVWAVAADRIEMTSHFAQRLGERGVIWADLLTVFDRPREMEAQGLEPHGWPRWRVAGQSADGREVAVVVALRDDGRIRLITVLWED